MANPAVLHSGPRLRSRRSILHPGHDPAVQQESLSLMRAALQKAGFDLERFDELKRRNDIATRKALSESRTAADERAPAMRDAVARSTEKWLKTTGVGGSPPPATGVFSLSTADQISVDPAFEFLSQNVAPWANSAQVILDDKPYDDYSFDGLVTFTFSWSNQTGQTNLFTVNALVGVTATCVVMADGYWWPSLIGPATAGSLLGHVKLDITMIENGQVVVPPHESSQAEIFADVTTTGAFTQGSIASQDVFRTYILAYEGLLVPSNAQVELNLSCEVLVDARDGGAQFIAAGNGRQVTAPGVIISTQPWIIQRGTES